MLVQRELSNAGDLHSYLHSFTFWNCNFRVCS